MEHLDEIVCNVIMKAIEKFAVHRVLRDSSSSSHLKKSSWLADGAD